MFQGGATSSNNNEEFDTLLQRIFVQHKAQFKGNQVMIDGLFELRDALNEMVKSCANNVEIVIFVNHILDQEIVIKRGNCENRIRITINSNGGMTHNWTKETWTKKAWDWWYEFLGLLKTFANLLMSVLNLIRKAIGLFAYGEEIAIKLIKAICEK